MAMAMAMRMCMMRMIVVIVSVSVSVSVIVSVVVIVIVSVVVRHGGAEAMLKLGKARFKHNPSTPSACRSVCMKIRSCALICPPTPP
jgi:hypothetical protein